jgi:glycerate dehydrogenase
MMRAVFVDFATVSAGDLDTAPLERVLPRVEYFPLTSAAELPQRVREAQIALANKARFDAAVLAGAPRLRLICLCATGTDNVDLAAARARGIAVCNIRAYCTASVVQHVFAMILALTQRLSEYDAAVRAGRWRDSAHFSLFEFPIRELAGRTLGIVGCGELGRAVARAGEAFGMQLAIAARPGAAAPAGRIPFDVVLARADVLSLHCPLTAQTRDLIGARELARMKPDALLVNTARGGLVDAAALADALRAGRLGGAGIDVLAEEPPVRGNPLLDGDIPRLIVTPHVAWAAREARQRALDEMARNVGAFLRGERRNRVV